MALQDDESLPVPLFQGFACRRADALKRRYKFAREAGCIGADRAARVLPKKEGQ